MDPIVDEVINLFVDNEHTQACLIASITLNELLKKHGYSSKIVEGYSRLSDEVEIPVNYRHYWVHVNGNDIDIGRLLTEKQWYPYYGPLYGHFLKTNGYGLFINHDGYRISNDEDNEALEDLYQIFLTHSIDGCIGFNQIPSFLKKYWTKNIKSN